MKAPLLLTLAVLALLLAGCSHQLMSQQALDQIKTQQYQDGKNDLADQMAPQLEAEYQRGYDEGFAAGKAQGIQEAQAAQEEIITLYPDTPAQPAEAAPSGSTVYITASGEKYHAAGCGSLRKSSQPLSLAQAKAQGYTPCGQCEPPQ